VVSRRFGIRLLLEGGERGGPELVEVGANGFESSGVELVHSASAFGPVDHEPSVLENPEVLGDGWPADRKRLGERTDGQWALPQLTEDGSSSGVAEGVELRTRVSIHLR
jgi:hypothetical protein